MFVVLLWPVCRCLFVSSASSNFQALCLLILISLLLFICLLLSCVWCEILFRKRTTLWWDRAGLTIRKKLLFIASDFYDLIAAIFVDFSGRRIQGQFLGWFLTQLRVNCRAEFLCFYSSIKLFMSVAVPELFLWHNAQEANCLQLLRSEILRSFILSGWCFPGKSEEFLLPHFCSTFLHLHRRRIFISL